MLAFKIAARFLKSAKGQTIMIVLGISIGVSVQVFIGSLIQGLQRSLVDATIGNSSQVTVVSADKNGAIENYEDLVFTIKGADNRTRHVSYVAEGSGFVASGGETEPILLRGFDFDLSEGIYQFNDRIIEGELPSSTNHIAIGKNLLDNLNLNLYDTVEISIPLVGSQQMEIVGIYDFGVKAVNERWILSTLSTAQTALNIGAKVSAIEMQVSDAFAADEIALNITSIINGETLNVTNWKEGNADLLSGLQGQSISSLMIQVFVTLSVVLGIASVLAITVLQKSKQLGILKAMGILDRQASAIFLFEGLMLGIMGAIGGISIGLGLAYSFTKFAVNPETGEPVVALYINPSFIAISAVIAVFAATMAALIPARRSAKLSVIEVIKNG